MDIVTFRHKTQHQKQHNQSEPQRRASDQGRAAAGAAAASLTKCSPIVTVWAAQLAPLGIDVEALAEVARNMATAREALKSQTDRTAGDILRMEAGAQVMQAEGFFAAPEEIRRRLMIHALGQVNGGTYPPRRGPVAALIAGLADGQAATLGGCQALLRRGEIWVYSGGVGHWK